MFLFVLSQGSSFLRVLLVPFHPLEFVTQNAAYVLLCDDTRRRKSQRTGWSHRLSDAAARDTFRGEQQVHNARHGAPVPREVRRCLLCPRVLTVWILLFLAQPGCAAVAPASPTPTLALTIGFRHIPESALFATPGMSCDGKTNGNCFELDVVRTVNLIVHYTGTAAPTNPLSGSSLEQPKSVGFGTWYRSTASIAPHTGCSI